MKLTTASLTLLAAAGLTVVIAGCGTKTAQTKQSPTVTASHAKPTEIIPTPAGTIGGTAPEPNGSMWVLAGNTSSRGIFQVQLSSKKIGGSVSVSNDANAIAESSTGVLALGVSTAATGAVDFLNGSNGAALSSVPLSGPIVSLAAGNDGVTFYALNGTSKAMGIAVINSQSKKIEETLPAPSDAVAVVPAPNEQSVYVLEPNGVVSQISTAGGKIETQFPIGDSGSALAISPNGNTLYVLKGIGGLSNVAVVDLATESVKEVMPAPADAVGISLSPDGQVLYDVVGNPSYGNIQGFKVP